MKDRARESGVNILSFGWVLKYIIKKERVHHSKSDSMCPICEKKKTLEEEGTVDGQFNVDNLPFKKKTMYLEAVKHMEEFPIQRHEYKTQKDRILGNVDGDECMIVLDFSQLQIQQSFRQDLIICIYRNYGTVDGLSQILKTYHYVSPPGTHADATFVIGSISHLIEYHKIFNGIKKVYIWTDGCGRQFKLTTNLVLWAYLITSYTT
ncbi:hypothetical protein DLAC_03502 [Tieghemostelium lacteum]|uniref:Uncharacterized protein n=1 Tax=Tieghemostelium lacteum TaxID=361077 RepID=A0A152A1L4_TIELA|nr:hypothetical protein DLAC_03502 [Tieghemostelium lacteum]|eukprot:KYR00007.1 hypothetical protein DLAC_03502 [Tieghemostelium lacteum]